MNHPPLNFTNPQSRLQSALISLGLVYLAIPNLLFLCGWFEPVVALPVSSLIVLSVSRAVLLSFRGVVRQNMPASLMAGVVGFVVATLVSFYFLFRAGILGFVPSYGDLTILRNAMFANLRDAAWPLILPDGKEMTYYLANMLPPAMLARLAPQSGQWAVVIWTLPCMLLIIALISTLITGLLSWGRKWVLTTFFLAVLCCTYFLPSVSMLLKLFNVLSGLNASLPTCGHPVVCGHALSGCGGIYNSFPPALLLTAILLTCRHRAEVVLPIALTLTVPLSPFGGIGMLPLVGLRWWMSVRGKKISVFALLPDVLLPFSMAILCAVYFLRADGESAVCLTPLAWGWKSFLIHEFWRLGAWLTLLLPLCFCVKRDAFFMTFVACYLLMSFLFIGTLPAPGEGQNNELWLKVAPCYMLITVTYWLLAWKRIGWYKYLLMGACLLVTLKQARDCVALMGSNAYLEVDDKWNGHLYHKNPFFNQSLPRCKTPIIPGIMLKSGGESENHFPGSILPKAPGCDYGRAPRPDVYIRW